MSTAETRESLADYHADFHHISNSMLSVFRQSRRRYQQRFVAKTMPHPEPTPEMQLGTALHALVFEPSTDINVLGTCEAPLGSGPRKGQRCDATAIGQDGGGQWRCGRHGTAGELTMPEGLVVTAAQGLVIASMSGALRSCAAADQLLTSAGEREQPHRWRDPDTGLRCRCRPDLATPEFLLDLKTCRDPSPRGFAKQIANLGYHRQAAWYQDGWRDRTGKVLPFVFVAVQSSEPYDVGIYELDREAIDLGRTENRSALRQLRDCYRHDDWEPPEAKRIHTLSLPKWAVYSEEYEIHGD